jgi:hypothetical protein
VISPAKFTEIVDLLKTESIRRTMEVSGVSKGTVLAIRRGDHPFCKGLPTVEQKPGLPQPVHPDTYEDDHRHSRFIIVHSRCPTCGGMTQAQVPCLLCQRREEKRKFDEWLADLLQPKNLGRNPWSLDEPIGSRTPSLQKTSGEDAMSTNGSCNANHFSPEKSHAPT